MRAVWGLLVILFVLWGVGDGFFVEVEERIEGKEAPKQVLKRGQQTKRQVGFPYILVNECSENLLHPIQVPESAQEDVFFAISLSVSDVRMFRKGFFIFFF